MKERLDTFFKKTSAKRIWPYFFVLAIGIMLMYLGGYTDRSSKNSVTKGDEPNGLFSSGEEEGEVSGFPNSDLFSEYEESLEKKLSETLSKVEGAGKVRVILTVSSKDRIELAEDVTYEATKVADSGGDAQNNLTEKKETKHVIVTEKDGSSVPVVVNRLGPEIEGAIIVAEGGGSAEIRSSLTRAASALLNLPVHKIEVLKMSAK